MEKVLEAVVVLEVLAQVGLEETLNMVEAEVAEGMGELLLVLVEVVLSLEQAEAEVVKTKIAPDALVVLGVHTPTQVL